HEIDVTLCDLVADHRAATPSAAAQMATPDRNEVLSDLGHLGVRLAQGLAGRAQRMEERVERVGDRLLGRIETRLQAVSYQLSAVSGRLDALSPLGTLARGFAVPRDATGRVLRRAADFRPGDPFVLRVVDGAVNARVEKN
ncbi:MAG TPA: exodeoxyribonuclease VII large subunit, partial [Gemmatimonadales bacterium]|nr:exodeoxyribonuclease VII large subunit [Gemmatimonadales bacterium]